MPNYNQTLQTNNSSLEEIITQLNNLPNAGEGGIELPELTNEATSADLLSGKQLINQEGSITEGTMPNNGIISQTMDGIDIKSVNIPVGYTSGGSISLDNTIDNEVGEQADLITQIQTALEGKVSYNTIYIGSTEPTNDIGQDGDIYIIGEVVE
jgi:hypothetical protein